MYLGRQDVEFKKKLDETLRRRAVWFVQAGYRAGRTKTIWFYNMTQMLEAEKEFKITLREAGVTPSEAHRVLLRSARKEMDGGLREAYRKK